MGNNNNNNKDARSSTNTSCFIQILGVGNDTATSTPSALLFFDRQRYLFNAGEGFQRFCVEHRLKLARVSAVLSTRVTTDATGGLPGMLLTMADTSCGGLLTGHSGIVLHGPPGINTLVNAFRTFINTKDMGFKVQEFGRGMAPSDIAAANALPPIVNNDLVTITPVVLHSSAGDLAAAAAEAGAEPDAKRQRVNGHPPPPSSSSPNQGVPAQPPPSSMYSQSINVPSATKSNPVACYVIKLPDIPGKFLIQKAAALGVPRGPLYGKLVKGESVLAMNGQKVTPDQVMEPSVPGPLVLMVDCPDDDFVQALINAPAFKNLVSSSSSSEVGEGAAKITCVVHFGPKAVTDLPAYKEWMAGLGEETTHILAAEGQGQVPPVLRKSTELQTRLNVIDSGLFKLPVSATAVMESAMIRKHNPGRFSYFLILLFLMMMMMMMMIVVVGVIYTKGKGCVMLIS
jgi:ribonuclease Z